VHLPALGDEAGHGGGEVGEKRYRGILLRATARAPRAGEGDEAGVRKLPGVDVFEELQVLRVRGREASFYVVEAKDV
jgi:hypothetical protein